MLLAALFGGAPSVCCGQLGCECHSVRDGWSQPPCTSCPNTATRSSWRSSNWRWGRPPLRDPTDDRLPDSALLLGFEAAFHPYAAVGVDETYDIEVDSERVTVRVHHGTVDVTSGGAGEHATLRIVTDREGFMVLPARGHAGDRLRIEGDTDALVRLQRMFSLA